MARLRYQPVKDTLELLTACWRRTFEVPGLRREMVGLQMKALHGLRATCDSTIQL